MQLRTSSLLIACALAGASLTACEVAPGGPGTGPDCSGNKCDGESFEPFQVVHCEHSQEVGVECWFTQPRQGHPLVVQASITALANPTSPTTSGRLGTHQFTATGSDVILPTPTSAEYPILVVVSLDIGAAEGRATSIREAGSLSASFRIERPTDSMESFDLPFLAWPVTLEVEDERGLFINADAPVTLEMAPFETFLSEERVTLENQLPRIDGPTELGFLLPPGTETLAVTGQYCASGCTDLSFEIPGPGRYRVGAGGLVQLEAEPPSDDAGTSDAGTSDAGMSDAGMVDAGPPTPTCGTEGQAPCDDGCAEWHAEESGTCHECGGEGQTRCRVGGGANVCQPDHRWDSPICRACGADDLTYCIVDGQRACNDGHRYERDDELCHACGADDLTYCIVDGQRACNDGHRYERNDELCHACGTDGLTYCSVNGQRACDDGHRYERNDELCHACGDDGETYCLVNGQRACNEGHRYQSSDQLCHACDGSC